MGKVKFLLAIVLMIVIPTSVVAAPQTTAWGNVTSLQDAGFYDEGMIVYISSTSVNPASCAAPGAYAINSSNGAYKTKSALLMAALLGNKEISFLIDDSGCENGGAYPRIISIYVR